MAYDKSKEKVFKEWKTGDGEGDIIVKVVSYNNGDKKVDLKRVAKSWKTDELFINKVGRLTWDDIQFLESIWEEIKEELQK